MAGGDLLMRQPAVPGGDMASGVLDWRASAPSAALPALLRCPTDLASTAVHAVATDTGETALLRWGPSLTWHVGAS
jgi:hypothetical protein